MHGKTSVLILIGCCSFSFVLFKWIMILVLWDNNNDDKQIIFFFILVKSVKWIKNITVVQRQLCL